MPENKPHMTTPSHQTRDACPDPAQCDELEQQVKILTQELESFSYAVSHDLGAPLRSIKGFSEALLEDHSEQLDDTGKDYLRRVSAAARRMGELIDAMLVLSRVARKDIRLTDVDLSKAARDIAEALHKQDPSRTVKWQISDGLHVEGDIDLLYIVLENLLGNAWKYSSRNTGETRIEFSVTEQDGQTVFFVRDNGCGFNTNYADKLFTVFQRLHGKEYEGTGVGLATVQRIIQRHQGRVWAESTPAEGSTFYFAFS
jgi:light-regulated signal transduction histidine kinase (bacteriophytochrome)